MSVQALEVDCDGFIVATLYQRVVEPVSGLTARIVTELPDTLADALPVIQVVRVGGGDDGVILEAPTVVLHGFAANQRQANRLLHAARTVLRTRVGYVVPIDAGRAVMTRVRNVSGPLWAPYENTNLRHAVMTVQPYIKITR